MTPTAPPGHLPNVPVERSYVLFSDVRDFALFACTILSLYCRVRQHQIREDVRQRQFARLMATLRARRRLCRERARQLADVDAERVPRGRETNSGELPSALHRGEVDRGLREPASSASWEGSMRLQEGDRALFDCFALPLLPSITAEEGSSHWARTRTLLETPSHFFAGGDGSAPQGGSEGEAAAKALLMRPDALSLLWGVPFEERVETCVDWLSVVSNCLTYFLRPSQVLYTFLFTNADFFLHVMAALSRRERSARLQLSLARAAQWRARLAEVREAWRPGGQRVSGTDGGPRRAAELAASSRHDGAASSSRPPVPSEKPEPRQRRSRWASALALVYHAVRRVGSWLVRHVTRAADLGVLVVMEAVGFVADAVQVLLPSGPGSESPRSPLRQHSPQAGTYIASLSSSFSSDSSEGLRAAAAADEDQDDSGTTSVRVARHRHVTAVEAWMQGPATLMGLNMLLTLALVVCHAAHLFFPVGALAGYLACAGTLLLLGQAAARVGVTRGLSHLPRCCPRRCVGFWSGRRRQPKGRGGDGVPHGAAVGDGQEGEHERAPGAVGEAAAADPAFHSGLHVCEHLFASGCSLFYLSMLFEEGPALWSTHVELMRWYVATVAMGIRELLVCIGPVASTASAASLPKRSRDSDASSSLAEIV